MMDARWQKLKTNNTCISVKVQKVQDVQKKQEMQQQQHHIDPYFQYHCCYCWATDPCSGRSRRHHNHTQPQETQDSDLAETSMDDNSL